MAFRFDMQGKTTQQQIIVAKRDADNKRMKQEAKNIKVEKKISNVNNEIMIFAVDKDTCPVQDNIIMKQQCSNCQYYMEFIMYNGQSCIKCSYKNDSEK